jgi:para-aminobenzoate synthetase component 2
MPLFGVCLGHQALGEAFGAAVVVAPELRHGRSSVVQHEGHGVFEGMPAPMVAGRYHSLVVKRESLGDDFEVTAWTDGLIMGMRHRTKALEGVQFHPESVLTQEGYRLVANWLERCGVDGAIERATALNVAAEQRRAALPQPAAH